MFEGLFGILAFFVTILALVTGTAVIGITLLTRHTRRAGKVGMILLVWIGAYAVLLLGFSFASRPRFIASGQERCFDEMCYSLKSVTITHTLKNESGSQYEAQGNYYVVTVQLRNAGKGTPQKPSYPSLSVVDAQGKSYAHFINMSSANQGELANPSDLVAPLWSQKILPGDSASQTVAFDLPADIRQPGLAVTEGIGPLSVIIIGDENSLFHAKTEFLLPGKP